MLYNFVSQTIYCEIHAYYNNSKFSTRYAPFEKVVWTCFCYCSIWPAAMAQPAALVRVGGFSCGIEASSPQKEKQKISRCHR